jgi:hypothetical protein
MIRHGKALLIAFYVQANGANGYLGGGCEVNLINLQDFALQRLENTESFSAFPAL